MCRAVDAPRHVPLPRRTSSTADVYYDRPRPTALAAEYKFIALRFSLRTPRTYGPHTHTYLTRAPSTHGDMAHGSWLHPCAYPCAGGSWVHKP